MDPGGGARRAQWLLVAGMAAGMAAAGWTLAVPRGTLPGDAAARVGERVITHDDWQRAVAAVEADRRTPLTAADRRRVLERLVDEELLVQHGLALGLAAHDRRLRGQLVADVVAAAIAAAPEPDDAALQRYFAENRAYFATPPRLRVAATRDGDAFAPPVPDALLPPAKLREYLGPRLTEVALALPVGESSALHDGAILRVLEREEIREPAFEDVREQVRAAVQRRAQEEALRRLLAELRTAGAVTMRSPE